MITSVSEFVRKWWPVLQLCSEFFVIVNFAIEDYPDRLPGISHWLMTAGEIYDRESSEAETEGPAKKYLVIRSTMCDGTRHPVDRSRSTGSSLAV